MGFWTKSLQILNLLCGNAKQSVRDLAQKTGFSRSSVHRLEQAMERRNRHPESWFWETEAGRSWVIRLVVATLYTFGLTRGVGAESISEFFSRLRLGTHVGCSPSAWRQVDGEIGRFSFTTYIQVNVYDEVLYNTSREFFIPLQGEEKYCTEGFKEIALIYGTTELCVLRMLLAFLVHNDLLENTLMFFVDGHSLYSAVVQFFSWHNNIIVILDWYHLQNICK